MRCTCTPAGARKGCAGARELGRLFAEAGVDASSSNAAGCGSHLQGRRPRAARQGRVRAPRRARATGPAQRADPPGRLSGLVPPRSRAGHPRRAPELLRSIPGLELAEPADQAICCGSAGIYNLVQPDAARALGDRKARQILDAEPGAYASSNPGCLIQVSTALRRAGRPLPSFHPVELLDASIRGVPCDVVTANARM